MRQYNKPNALLGTSGHTCIMCEYEGYKARIVKSRANNELCHPHPMAGSLVTLIERLIVTQTTQTIQTHSVGGGGVAEQMIEQNLLIVMRPTLTRIIIIVPDQKPRRF